MVKVSKLVQRKLIPYSSIIASGAFQKLIILEIFHNSYSVYRDLTISQSPSKTYFCCLAYSQMNINPTAEKSSKN